MEAPKMVELSHIENERVQDVTDVARDNVMMFGFLDQNVVRDHSRMFRLQ